MFGVPHDKWGETPVAAVVLRDDASSAPPTLRDWINARVAATYQRVTDVMVLDEFPRNAAGKTLKRELQDQYQTPRPRP